MLKLRYAQTNAILVTKSHLFFKEGKHHENESKNFPTFRSGLSLCHS